jgi:hypothetical protein
MGHGMDIHAGISTPWGLPPPSVVSLRRNGFVETSIPFPRSHSLVHRLCALRRWLSNSSWSSAIGYSARSIPLTYSDDNRDGHAVKNYYLNLSYGTYEGTLDTDNDIVAFYNVRFALPPLGNLRWRKPVPPTGKKGKVHDGSEGGTCFNAYPDWWGRSVHSKSLRLTVGHR